MAACGPPGGPRYHVFCADGGPELGSAWPAQPSAAGLEAAGGCSGCLHGPWVPLCKTSSKRQQGPEWRRGWWGSGWQLQGALWVRSRGWLGPFCPARERALLPDLSQTAQRAAPAPSPRPAAGGELPARPSTPCPLREERRALKWSLWAGPQAAAQALGAVPTLAGSTWAAGHAQPSAPSSPLRCGSPASVLGLLRFCDWSQALCQLLGPSSQASEAETVIGPISQTRL